MLKTKLLKIMSVSLSSLILINAILPNIYAKHEDTQITTSATKNNSTEKSKSFYEKHPTLSKIGIGIGAVAGFVAICKTCKLIYREWYLKDVVTKIDDYSKEEINQHLNEEIEKYKNRDREIFKIDETLIKKSDKRALLLTMMKLNYLFDKYSEFTKQLIEYKKSQSVNRREFLLRPINLKYDNILVWLIAAELTETDLGGFGFACLNNFKETLYISKKSVETGFWSTRKQDELIDSIITHEFGHAMSVLYLIRKYRLHIASRRGLGIDETLKINDDIETLFVESQKIRDIIIKETENFDIKSFSQYGQLNGQEFFAEAFAHLECNDKDNIQKIGQRLEEFIVKKMKYLAPKDSKFCKDITVRPGVEEAIQNLANTRMIIPA